MRKSKTPALIHISASMGGTEKTTLDVLTLSRLRAALGEHQVLIIDTDPQGNSAQVIDSSNLEAWTPTQFKVK